MIGTMNNLDVGKGSISKARERKTENHPSHTGSITFSEAIPAGTKLWLSAWINKGQDGSSYLSIKAAKPREQQSNSFAPPPPSGYRPRETAERYPQSSAPTNDFGRRQPADDLDLDPPYRGDAP